MLKQENHSENSALLQAFRAKQAQQNGDPNQAMNTFQSLLKDPEIHEMLVRLRDK